MSEAEALDPASLVEMTAEIVSAYVVKNSVPLADMPALIASVHAALGRLGTAAPEEAPAARPTPFVSIKKSVTDEFIISLEDGRKFKSMKRYLSGLGMTPDQYRAKWGLSKDYPMVAPAYAARRSELAKSSGLGRRGVDEALPEPDEVLIAPVIPDMRKPSRPNRDA